MKKFWEFLREHALRIIDFKKKQYKVNNKKTAGIK